MIGSGCSCMQMAFEETSESPTHRSYVGTSDSRGVVRAFWLVDVSYYEDIYEAEYSGDDNAVFKADNIVDLLKIYGTFDVSQKLKYNIHYLEDGVPVEVAMITNCSTRSYSRNRYIMQWLQGLSADFYSAFIDKRDEYFWIIRRYKPFDGDRDKAVNDIINNINVNGEFVADKNGKFRISPIVRASFRTILTIFSVFNHEQMIQYYRDGIIPICARKWTIEDWKASMESSTPMSESSRESVSEEKVEADDADDAVEAVEADEGGDEADEGVDEADEGVDEADAIELYESNLLEEVD